MVGGFNEVSGLQAAEVKATAKAGQRVHSQTGRTDQIFRELGFEKGHCGLDHSVIMSDDMQNQDRTQNLSVVLMDNAGKATLEFSESVPVKWAGPGLRAGASEIAVETVELAHKGLQLSSRAHQEGRKFTWNICNQSLGDSGSPRAKRLPDLCQVHGCTARVHVNAGCRLDPALWYGPFRAREFHPSSLDGCLSLRARPCFSPRCGLFGLRKRKTGSRENSTEWGVSARVQGQERLPAVEEESR